MRVAAKGSLGLCLLVGVGCDPKQGSVGDYPLDTSGGETTGSDPGDGDEAQTEDTAETGGAAEGPTDGPEINCVSPVLFEDPALEAVVRDAIGVPLGEIDAADVATLVSLNAGGMGVSTLGGIECLTGLGWIGLTDNNIVDMSPMTDIDLNEIDIQGNPLDENACCTEIRKHRMSGALVSFGMSCDPYPGCPF